MGLIAHGRITPGHHMGFALGGGADDLLRAANGAAAGSAAPSEASLHRVLAQPFLTGPGESLLAGTSLGTEGAATLRTAARADGIAERALLARATTPIGEPVRISSGTLTGDVHRQAIALRGGGSRDVRSVEVVLKHPGAQTAQELFGAELAALMGIEDLVPGVVRHADGSTWTSLRHGEKASAVGMRTPDRLAEVRAARYERLGAEPDAARALGRLDAELTGIFDYLLANSDRNLGNALVDARRGAISLIDQGMAGNGAARMEPRVPTLRAALQPLAEGRGPGHSRVVRPSREALDVVDAIDDDAVRALHARVAALPAPDASHGAQLLGEHAVRGEHFRDGLLQRIAHVREHGAYQFL